MKRLIACLAACAAIAAPAAPFAVTEPLPVGVTQCGAFIDAAPKVIVPVTVVAGIRTCEIDLSGVSTAAHTVKFTAIANDPIWGSQESAPSAVPFPFSRPAPPSAPVVSGLKP